MLLTGHRVGMFVVCCTLIMQAWSAQCKKCQGYPNLQPTMQYRSEEDMGINEGRPLYHNPIVAIRLTDPKDLPFKELILKMVMLMTLSNADRASDHHLLDIRSQ